MKSPYTLDAQPKISAAQKRLLSAKKILFDGPFKGDYSLAIVNRNLARALIRLGLNVSCFSREEDWRQDPMLRQMPDVFDAMISSYPAKGNVDIHLRNPWPPETSDMVGKANAYVCFAWEETDIPIYMTDRFSNDLDLLMVTANSVRDAIAGSGVRTPVEVVANGCDHMLDSQVSAAPYVKTKKKRVLHISSCFPRKGAELLVDSFLLEFSGEDDVELLIKTTPNPHNFIEDYVKGKLRGMSSPPLITVINSHWSHSQLAGLYETSDVFVAPSKGEGFGLPFAEALLYNLPVVATKFSGHTDFCTSESSFPIDFKLSASTSHVSSGYSLWAEPDVASIARNMRYVLENPVEARRRTAAGRSFIEQHLTWEKVAERVCKALVKHVLEKPVPPEVSKSWSIDVVSTWQQKCGIATYSEHLYSTPLLIERVKNIFGRVISADDRIDAQPSEGRANVQRVWNYDRTGVDALIQKLGAGTSDILWFQHHPGHFSGSDMSVISAALAMSTYKARVMTMHNVKELAQKNELQWAKHFHKIFVHSAADAAILSVHGYNDAVVIPHGFQRPPQIRRDTSLSFTVGSFGFLYPHKNVDLLAAAIGEVKSAVIPDIRLKLLNCVTESPNSLEAYGRLSSVISLYDLQDNVEADYSFLDEDQIVSRLQECDLIVFPYGHSEETATGAARVALLAERPLLCSTSPVLRDLHPISHVVDNIDVERLAEAIGILAGNETLLNMYQNETREFLNAYSYERVAERYAWHIAQILG